MTISFTLLLMFDNKPDPNKLINCLNAVVSINKLMLKQ